MSTHRWDPSAAQHAGIALIATVVVVVDLMITHYLAATTSTLDEVVVLWTPVIALVAGWVFGLVLWAGSVWLDDARLRRPSVVAILWGMTIGLVGISVQVLLYPAGGQ